MFKICGCILLALLLLQFKDTRYVVEEKYKLIFIQFRKEMNVKFETNQNWMN